MSINLTRENFERKSIKDRLEGRFYDQIIYDDEDSIVGRRRLSNGYNYLGLTGPAFLRHYVKNGKRIIGKRGRFVVVEKEYDVYISILSQVATLPPEDQQRITIVHGNIWELAPEIIKSFGSKPFILDLDFCDTFKAHYRDGYEKLDKLAGAVHTKCLNMALIITHSLHNGYYKGFGRAELFRAIRNDIPDPFYNRGFLEATINIKPYRSMMGKKAGDQMVSALYIFRSIPYFS